MSVANGIKFHQTQRGFVKGEFKDGYGLPCSIQKSSSMVDHIWLGVDKPTLTVFENEDMGAYIKTDLPKNWQVDTRMHLTREQVADLLPSLEKFVETGEI